MLNVSLASDVIANCVILLVHTLVRRLVNTANYYYSVPATTIADTMDGNAIAGPYK